MLIPAASSNRERPGNSLKEEENRHRWFPFHCIGQACIQLEKIHIYRVKLKYFLHYASKPTFALLK